MGNTMFNRPMKVHMLRLCATIALLLCCTGATAQEVLLPLQTVTRQITYKSGSSSAVSLPFFDDFAGRKGSPSPTLWMAGGAWADDGAGLRPPTIGVATLDALSSNGRLYEHATTSIFPADTLCSLPIRLDGLTANDSVAFSFYYLPGGGKGNLWERIGDTPDAYDSLFVDFYRPSDSTWVTVWCRGGISVDSLIAQTGMEWQYIVLPITNSAYFDSTFQFRFRNYCSLPTVTKEGLAGNCDFWHLDYILLDRGRDTASLPSFHDVTFVDPAPSLLSEYQAMPARQYRSTDMAQYLDIRIANLFASTLASHYGYAILDETGDTLYSYDGGYENAPPFLPGAQYQTEAAHAHPAVGYSLPESTEERTYTVVHTVREGVSGDSHTANDTLLFVQHLGDYYAYDDGIPENGYGLTSTASRVYLAYRFDLNMEDTLTAVGLCFNRSADSANANVRFYLTVWSDENGHPGQVLYRDEESRVPQFDIQGSFFRYPLEAPVVVNGSFFVGFEQSNNTYINLGFDRNRNTSSRIWFLTGTEWQQSILSGSLMLRPHFGAKAAAIDNVVYSTHRIYPNPAKQEVHISPWEQGMNAVILDIMGRQVLSTTTTPINVSQLQNGIYLIRITDNQGHNSIQKLIIKH